MAAAGGIEGKGEALEQPPTRVVERLNAAVVQQLNLESVKTRAVSLFKAISRILEELDAISRTSGAAGNPKWQDILGQFSMVNLELFNIVEDIKKVSKAFVVHPKNVNADNAAILPVMLSSKLLPEMEMDDNSKREQLLLGMQNLPVALQIEKLKNRIDMIGAACESAEKVIADTRKAYFGTRQGPTLLPTLDKVQAAKIQDQENLLRQAVNLGEGLRMPADQRQITSSLPVHLVDILGESGQTFTDSSGMYMKSTPPLTANNNSSQGTLFQASGAPHVGRAAASPSAAANSSFENTASPLPYANSPRSGASMMNTASPQPLQQQQQRQKIMQLSPQQQQLMAQQLRQSTLPVMGQTQQGQLHDLQGQSQQKFQPLHGQHQMQFSQSLGAQPFQGRQLAAGTIQHGLVQSQLNQGNQLNRHFNQFSNPANTALFSAAQITPTSQMLGMSGANRNLTSQNLSDQMFGMGAPGSMMPIQQQQQQQQHSSQGAYGSMAQNMQNLQPGMVPLQNAPQNLANFQQQRPQNQ